MGVDAGVARGALLNKLADLGERDAEKLARLESLGIGKPAAQPAMLDVPNAIATFRHFAGWADKIQGQTIPAAGNTLVVKPAEDAPLSILHLGTLIEEAGFPAPRSTASSR